ERCRSRHFQRPEPGNENSLGSNQPPSVSGYGAVWSGQHQRKGEPASAEGGPRRCVWRLVPGCRCC
ncbi:unnamed protein product, partial [Symbiodinium microadriaticum]